MFRAIALALLLITPAAAEYPQWSSQPSPRFVAISPGEADHSVAWTQMGQGPVRAFLDRVRRGIVWRWASPAYYHRAAVVVQMPDGSGGSGICVRISNGACIILTCDHVTGGQRIATIRWMDGTRSRGQVIVASSENDCAAIYIQSPPRGFVSVPLAAANPSASDEVVVLGFGGPEFGRFRPYVARPVQWMGDLCIDAPSISGDSGSGMLVNGAVVGIQFGAFNTPQASLRSRNGSVPLVYPATSRSTVQELTAITQRACDMIGGGCGPVSIGQPGGGYQQPQGGGSFYPDQYSPPSQPPSQQPPVQQPAPQQPPASQPAPSLPPQDQPACDCDCCKPKAPENPGCGCSECRDGECGCGDGQSSDCSCDEELIAQQVIDQLKNDESLKGPKGDPGEITEDHLAKIVDAVVEQLAGDPRLVGPRGPPGEAAEADINQLKDRVIQEIIAEGYLDQRFILVGDVDGEKQVIDDETYGPGEPIVLDIQKIRRAVTPKSQ